MSGLFFSKYIEGSSANQALEIYNGTDAAVDLTGYTIQFYPNGSPTPNLGLTIDLTGQNIAAGDVLLIVSPFANDPALTTAADFTPASPPGLSIDGNNALVLRQGNTIIDSIGQIGVDPGAGGWSNNGVSTDEQTLQRKATVLTGDSNPFDPFDPSVQWEAVGLDNFTGVGNFVGDLNRAPNLTGNVTLTAIASDVSNANNQGNTVAELLAGIVTDPDFNPQGLAITGVNNTNGTWQYSTDGGTNWQAIVNVANNNALTLLGSTKLYEADGTAPATQGWLALASVLSTTPPTFPVTETVEATSTRINTNADEDIYAGYSNFSFNPVTDTYTAVNPFFPTLDNNDGYAITFDLEVLSAAQTNASRAGFNIIAVSDDATKAIQLGFQDDQIFAQTLNGMVFEAGESQAFDTTQNTQYTLEVQGNTYELLANGNSILTGALRDYAPGNTNGAPDPYEVSNFVFLGDDTTSGQGEFRLGDIDLTTSNRVRFVPDNDFIGNAALQFRAWDTTDGSTDGQFGVDASQTGGDNAFSTLLGNAAIAVTPAGAPPGLANAFLNFEQWVSRIAIKTGVVYQSVSVDFNIEIGGLRIAPLFDEASYLAQNPDVAAAIQAGSLRYGFEHFVLKGIDEGRSCGAWFDQDYYLAQNPDVAAAVSRREITAIKHFFLIGHKEQRNPNPWFDANDYLLNNPDVKAAVDAGAFDSAFEHYSEYGIEEGRQSGLLFEEAFYLKNNPDVAAAVANGTIALGMYHFFAIGQSEGRDPSALFDQSAYLERYGDVAAAVAGGAFASGFEHYLLYGRAEGRITV